MPKPNVAEEPDDRPDALTAFESKLVNLLALLLVVELSIQKRERKVAKARKPKR